MKTFFFLLVLGFGWFVNSNSVFAQRVAADSVLKSKPYINSIYAELGGNGIIGSVNYERFDYSPDRPNSTMAIRFGLVYMPSGTISRSQASSIVLPAEVSMFWGKKAIKPEVGIGFTFLQSFSNGNEYNSEGSSKVRLFPVFRVGLRHEMPNKSFFWRLGLTPALIKENPEDQPQIFPWAGLGIGFKFGRK